MSWMEITSLGCCAESPDVAITSTYVSSFEASSHSHFHLVGQGFDLSMCRPGSSQETLSSPKDGTAEFFQVSFGIAKQAVQEGLPVDPHPYTFQCPNKGM
jgi:hypothetical protein